MLNTKRYKNGKKFNSLLIQQNTTNKELVEITKSTNEIKFKADCILKEILLYS